MVMNCARIKGLFLYVGTVAKNSVCSGLVSFCLNLLFEWKG